MNVTTLRDEIRTLEAKETRLVPQERAFDKACDSLLATDPAKLHEPVEFTDSGRPITPASRLGACRERLSLVRDRLRALRQQLPTPEDDAAARAEVDALADRLASARVKFDAEEAALGAALRAALLATVETARLRREAFEVAAQMAERCKALGVARPTAPGVPVFRATTITSAAVLRRASLTIDDETSQVHPVDPQLAQSVAAMLGGPERARVPEGAAR